MQSTGSDRERNNRELLWVRLYLAEAMRSHGEAPMLFAELVPISNDNSVDMVVIDSLVEEPEPPYQLTVAESALRLVRDSHYDHAANLLQQEGLTWARPEHFWIVFGGPMAGNITCERKLKPRSSEEDEKGRRFMAVGFGTALITDVVLL
ncbi:uncharacterized protein Z518_04064 [Rhinocladiella mackenziei CBS 650.93]|uniref:Uncharacterized protein n=1 Tax=Rhinocladiella mackenziei CBS 650.93 TaxID=1442369 RepID=A0A0D2JAF0_9EURO|nr:uncharacterized protein Z518_04064 [Rhinocladiella mackenziei CBS 650.93]KIX06090.1 hypothetical protein Z518_04064 [Rhinocladiella mackenziei CBS 650.93]